MSVKLPNGATVALSHTFGAAKVITAISNDDPAVAAAAAHGFADGAILLLESDWEDLNERAVRVAGSVADAFDLEGFDTSDLLRYPVGLGTGSAKAVSDWTAIDQIIGTSSSGGDQQFWSYSPLDSNRSKQLPTERNAQSMAFTLADDETKPWYAALDLADRLGDVRILRVTLRNGARIYYPGVVSFNKVPTLTKNEGMAVTMTFSMNSDITRYRP